MNQFRLLNTMLCLSAACLTISNIAVAKQNAASVQSLKMTERNIQECTNLLDKVAESDKKIHEDMRLRQARAVQNSAMLATINPPSTFIKDLVAEKNSRSVSPVTSKDDAIKPISSEKSVALPVTQTTTTGSALPIDKKPLPANTQVFASDDPKAIDHLTGKNPMPLMASLDHKTPKIKTDRAIVPKPIKVSAIKPKPSKTLKPQPRIELFAPNNEFIDLDHLKGKSADWKELTKPRKTAVDKPQKTNTSALKLNSKKTS